MPLIYGIVAVVTGPEFGLSVGISVTVSVPSNKVRVVIVLTKNVVTIISLASSCRLSGESQTSCARLVRVRIVVAMSRGFSGGKQVIKSADTRNGC